MAGTKPQRRLPERYRQARNIAVGYEIRACCNDDAEHWVPVVRAEHIHAPLAICRLELDWSGVDCTAGDVVVVERLDAMVYSRRPVGLS